MLSFKVLDLIHGYWGIKVILPSRFIVPDNFFISPIRACNKLDFPEENFPTIAINSPFLIFRLPIVKSIDSLFLVAISFSNYLIKSSLISALFFFFDPFFNFFYAAS